MLDTEAHLALDSVERLSRPVELTLVERKLVREAVGAHKTASVVVVDGAAPPRATGSRWHYTTKGGTIINHPSAYSKNGWSNMIYVPSTARVEVGAQWILAAREKKGK